jgi:hypothetical protein
VEFIFSPDLHFTLDLGVYIHQPETLKKLGDGFDGKLVMKVMWSVD